MNTAHEPLSDRPAPGTEFGFTYRLDQAGVDAFAGLLADAPFDPGLDERIANETCPSCGRLLRELTPGHAWSLDLRTRESRCSDPPYPGGPATFTMDSGGALETRPAAVAVPWERP